MTAEPIRATLTVAETPPSMNVVVGRGSRWAFTRAKRQWQETLGRLLMVESVPRGLERVEATAILTFERSRRRDTGNYRTVLEKALGDALVAGGWLPDDTPEHFEFGAVLFELGGPRTAVELVCFPGR